MPVRGRVRVLDKVGRGADGEKGQGPSLDGREARRKLKVSGKPY